MAARVAPASVSVPIGTGGLTVAARKQQKYTAAAGAPPPASPSLRMNLSGSTKNVVSAVRGATGIDGALDVLDDKMDAVQAKVKKRVEKARVNFTARSRLTVSSQADRPAHAVVAVPAAASKEAEGDAQTVDPWHVVSLGDDWRLIAWRNGGTQTLALNELDQQAQHDAYIERAISGAHSVAHDDNVLASLPRLLHVFNFKLEEPEQQVAVLKQLAKTTKKGTFFGIVADAAVERAVTSVTRWAAVFTGPNPCGGTTPYVWGFNPNNTPRRLASHPSGDASKESVSLVTSLLSVGPMCIALERGSRRDGGGLRGIVWDVRMSADSKQGTKGKRDIPPVAYLFGPPLLTSGAGSSQTDDGSNRFDNAVLQPYKQPPAASSKYGLFVASGSTLFHWRAAKLTEATKSYYLALGAKYVARHQQAGGSVGSEPEVTLSELDVPILHPSISIELGREVGAVAYCPTRDQVYALKVDGQLDCMKIAFNTNLQRAEFQRLYSLHLDVQDSHAWFSPWSIAISPKVIAVQCGSSFSTFENLARQPVLSVDNKRLIKPTVTTGTFGCTMVMSSEKVLVPGSGDEEDKEEVATYMSVSDGQMVTVQRVLDDGVCAGETELLATEENGLFGKGLVTCVTTRSPESPIQPLVLGFQDGSCSAYSCASKSEVVEEVPVQWADLAPEIVDFVFLVMQFASFPTSRDFPWSSVAEPFQVVLPIVAFSIDWRIEFFLAQFWFAALFVVLTLLGAETHRRELNELRADEERATQVTKRASKIGWWLVWVCATLGFIPFSKILIGVVDCTFHGNDVGWSWDRDTTSDWNFVDRVRTATANGVTDGNKLSLGKYPCFEAVHMAHVVVSVPLLLGLIAIAIRLAPVDGSMDKVVNWIPDKTETFFRIASPPFRGPFTATQLKPIASWTNLSAKLTLVAAATLFTKRVRLLAIFYCMAAVGALASTLRWRVYSERWTNILMIGGRLVGAWTCVCGLITVYVNNPLVHWPAIMLWVGWLLLLLPLAALGLRRAWAMYRDKQLQAQRLRELRAAQDKTQQQAVAVADGDTVANGDKKASTDAVSEESSKDTKPDESKAEDSALQAKATSDGSQAGAARAAAGPHDDTRTSKADSETKDAVAQESPALEELDEDDLDADSPKDGDEGSARRTRDTMLMCRGMATLEDSSHSDVAKFFAAVSTWSEKLDAVASRHKTGMLRRRAQQMQAMIAFQHSHTSKAQVGDTLEVMAVSAPWPGWECVVERATIVVEHEDGSSQTADSSGAVQVSADAGDPKRDNFPMRPVVTLKLEKVPKAIKVSAEGRDQGWGGSDSSAVDILVRRPDGSIKAQTIVGICNHGMQEFVAAYTPTLDKAPLTGNERLAQVHSILREVGVNAELLPVLAPALLSLKVESADDMADLLGGPNDVFRASHKLVMRHQEKAGVSAAEVGSMMSQLRDGLIARKLKRQPALWNAESNDPSWVLAAGDARLFRSAYPNGVSAQAVTTHPSVVSRYACTSGGALPFKWYFEVVAQSPNTGYSHGHAEAQLKVGWIASHFVETPAQAAVRYFNAESEWGDRLRVIKVVRAAIHSSSAGSIREGRLLLHNQWGGVVEHFDPRRYKPGVDYGPVRRDYCTDMSEYMYRADTDTGRVAIDMSGHDPDDPAAYTSQDFFRFGLRDAGRSFALLAKRYYDKEGPWAGFFKMKKAVGLVLVSATPNTCAISIEYTCEIVNKDVDARQFGGDSETTSKDHRIFHFSKVAGSGVWVVSKMDDYLSGENATGVPLAVHLSSKRGVGDVQNSVAISLADSVQLLKDGTKLDDTVNITGSRSGVIVGCAVDSLTRSVTVYANGEAVGSALLGTEEGNWRSLYPCLSWGPGLDVILRLNAEDMEFLPSDCIAAGLGSDDLLLSSPLLDTPEYSAALAGITSLEVISVEEDIMRTHVPLFTSSTGCFRGASLPPKGSYNVVEFPDSEHMRCVSFGAEGYAVGSVPIVGNHSLSITDGLSLGTNTVDSWDAVEVGLPAWRTSEDDAAVPPFVCTVTAVDDRTARFSAVPAAPLPRVLPFEAELQRAPWLRLDHALSCAGGMAFIANGESLSCVPLIAESAPMPLELVRRRHTGVAATDIVGDSSDGGRSLQLVALFGDDFVQVFARAPSNRVLFDPSDEFFDQGTVSAANVPGFPVDLKICSVAWCSNVQVATHNAPTDGAEEYAELAARSNTQPWRRPLPQLLATAQPAAVIIWQRSSHITGASATMQVPPDPRRPPLRALRVVDYRFGGGVRPSAQVFMKWHDCCLICASEHGFRQYNTSELYNQTGITRLLDIGEWDLEDQVEWLKDRGLPEDSNFRRAVTDEFLDFTFERSGK